MHQSISHFLPVLSVLVTLWSGLASGQDTAVVAVEIDRDFQSPKIDFQAPDLSPYTAAKVAQQLPTARDGSAMIGPTSGERFLDEAVRRERGEDLARRQGTAETRAIFVEGGAITLQAIAESLADTDAITIEAGIATLKLPLLVRAGATLIVQGEQTPTLRLSTDHGAFIANAGELVILGAEVVGWDEAAGRPSVLTNSKSFRPFIASFVRSETFLAESRFSHLGYDAATAYGLSLSTQPERVRGETTKDSPTGTIVANTFDNLYYGFYSYEARDVAIVGNTYSNSIVYGIDPHDRSTRLLIARNTVSGTKKKHGIIGSRGIRDSVIFENTSRDNAGSGVMLDRQCEGNVLAGNRVHNCGQGIAIYESSNNLIVDNVVANCVKSGVRVRNSSQIRVSNNTLARNHDYAYELTAKELTNRMMSTSRNDGYEIGVEALIDKTRITGNRGFAKSIGPIVSRIVGVETGLETAAIASKLGVPLNPPRDDSDDRKFGGELKSYQDRLQAAFDRSGPAVLIRHSRSTDE